MPSHSGLDGNEMVDFLNRVVFRSEQQSRHGIEVKQIETSLFFSEAKSSIRVHCTEKWNHLYKTYLLAIIIDSYLLIYHFHITLNAKKFLGSN